jgi:hypothetical protein
MYYFIVFSELLSAFSAFCLAWLCRSVLLDFCRYISSLRYLNVISVPQLHLQLLPSQLGPQSCISLSSSACRWHEEVQCDKARSSLIFSISNVKSGMGRYPQVMVALLCRFRMQRPTTGRTCQGSGPAQKRVVESSIAYICILSPLLGKLQVSW